MGIIKSIPCGSMTLEAYRNDAHEVMVELKELLPGGTEGRKIIWSHISEDELRRAEQEYVIKPALIRKRNFTVSDMDGTKIVMLTLAHDKQFNTILLQFEQKMKADTKQLFITLNQEKLADFLRHVTHALRFRPGEYAF